MKRTLTLAVVAAASILGLAGCSTPDSQDGGKIELTMWVAGDCPPATCTDAALAKGFEKQNPDISIKIVTQPTDSYFAALQTASVTGKGPDLGTMWAGSYMTRFKQYLVDAHDHVSDKLISDSASTSYFSEDIDSTKQVYAVPREGQFYIGLYNKKLFADNGITDVPTTWSELRAVSEKLSAAGVLPMVQGAQGGGAQFQPLNEWSYLAAALPAEDWSRLYDGEMKYDNPVLKKQLESWAGLYKDGYLNEDAFNFQDTEATFSSGKAAMLLGAGSWSIAEFEAEMGDNLGVMVPPYAGKDQHTLVEMAGSGYSAFNYSKHESEAGKFLAFVMSDKGQQTIADSGQPATRPGFETSLAQMNVLTEMSADPRTTHYPMFDNFSQASVSEAIFKNVSQVLVGQLSADDALAAVDNAFTALPADEKKVNIPLGTTK